MVILAAFALDTEPAASFPVAASATTGATTDATNAADTAEATNFLFFINRFLPLNIKSVCTFSSLRESPSP